MKTAVVCCTDTGPLESLYAMLSEGLGYQLKLPGAQLRQALKRMGCDNIRSVEDTMHMEGVDEPIRLSEASEADVARADLFVAQKAQKDYEKIVGRWPNLTNKVLWYRCNGGEPCVVPGAGDEITPVCPILTPNLWYRSNQEALKPATWVRQPPKTQVPLKTLLRAYSCYPPFYRFNEYFDLHRPGGPEPRYEAPLCLVHNLKGWGFGHHALGAGRLGVKMHGRGSPDGLLLHRYIPDWLSVSLAYVHLKTNDAPGYALYEALAAGCPVIVSQRLIYKCLMHELFVDGETCLVYDHCSPEMVHHGHTEEEIETNIRQIAGHLEHLRDPKENMRIGYSGRGQLADLMWDAQHPPDTESLRKWLEEMYV